MHFSIDPAGLHARGYSLVDLICRAYAVGPYQLAGAVGWMKRERFDLDAVTGAPKTIHQQMAMLRVALAERFGLRISEKTRPTAVWVLVAAKGGARIAELGVGERPPPPSRPELSGEIYFTPAVTIPGLVTFLNRPNPQRALRRHVIDGTGLKGRYNLHLELGADPVSRGGRSGFRVHFEDLPRALAKLGLQLKPEVSGLSFYTVEAAHEPTRD